MRNRRDFIKAAGVGIAAAAMPGIATGSVSSADGKKSKFDFQLGIASYSLRKFSQAEALNMAERCGIKRITFKSMHLPLDSDKQTIDSALAACKEKGITLYGGGVITMRNKEQVDEAFAYAKAANMEMIVGVPYAEVLDYVNEKIQEYDIKVAIHNHGPGDDRYPSANSAYEKIKNLDKRFGLCVDIGHTRRIDRDPIQDIKDCFDRVFDIHIKDVTDNKPEGKTCIIGRGIIDFPHFLKSVIKLGYKGTLALEYEADADDPLPGMMESFGYVRGILATM